MKPRKSPWPLKASYGYLQLNSSVSWSVFMILLPRVIPSSMRIRLKVTVHVTLSKG
jgi:hypothetical protein